MKFLGAITGKAKRGRIRNAHITEELRMEDIQNQIEGNGWFRHIKRMDEHRILKTLLEMKMTEKRPKGRPQKRWLNQVNRHTERQRQFWRKVEEMQEWKDKDSWRLLYKS
jgi:hypothetical protein